jgi:hypothetical protein
MNIGAVDREPKFLKLAAHAFAAGVLCHSVRWQPVRVVKLVDTLRCERRAFGHAGSTLAAHKGRS